jgi:ABC exporter DevB family membrane fusion protein
MKRIAAIAACFAAALGAVLWVRFLPAWRGESAAPGTAVRAAERPPALVVTAPGLVEAASEEIAVRAEIPGRITQIAVEEGQKVERGQIIAVLDDAEWRARADAAQAEVQQREAELTAGLNGANQLQRRDAWVGLKEAEAVVQQASAEFRRRQSLYAQGAISREQLEKSASDLDVAQQRLEAASLRREMAGAHILDTDRERLEAAVRSARARFQEARLTLAKATIRAPIAGVVLHRFQHTGELVSPESAPIVTLADASELRVRAEVDEDDVASVRPDQKAYVTAQAYGDRRFAGHVIRIAGVLGKKNVKTGDPAERADTKVLETLIELDPGAQLPLGLRVTAYLVADH